MSHAIPQAVEIMEREISRRAGVDGEMVISLKTPLDLIEWAISARVGEIKQLERARTMLLDGAAARSDQKIVVKVNADGSPQHAKKTRTQRTKRRGRPPAAGGQAPDRTTRTRTAWTPEMDNALREKWRAGISAEAIKSAVGAGSVSSVYARAIALRLPTRRGGEKGSAA